MPLIYYICCTAMTRNPDLQFIYNNNNLDLDMDYNISNYTTQYDNCFYKLMYGLLSFKLYGHIVVLLMIQLLKLVIS